LLGQPGAVPKFAQMTELTVDTDRQAPYTRFSNLGDAMQQAASCRRCGLCETRQNVVLFDGNPQAAVMVIGEGPGHWEDGKGVPFVGRAGQLLTKILESVNLNRKEDTYICNVVKCRPPDNRVPTEEEAEACRPYLEAQIEFVNPRIILLTGATAVRHILKIKEPISRIRGQWFDYANGAKVMPVFHPSYLLRNDSREVGSPKWLMWQDIRKVRKLYDQVIAT